MVNGLNDDSWLMAIEGRYGMVGTRVGIESKQQGLIFQDESSYLNEEYYKKNFYSHEILPFQVVNHWA